MKLTETLVLARREITRTYEAETIGDILTLRARVREEDRPPEAMPTDPVEWCVSNLGMGKLKAAKFVAFCRAFGLDPMDAR